MASRFKSLADFRAYERAQPNYLDHVELLYSMHEISRLLSVHFDRAMARHKLTHSQWWALMHLLENDGVTQTEFAAIMQLGRASTGTLIERLEAKGWVERRPDPADSRVRRVYLRDPAVAVFELMNAEGLKVFRTWLDGIGPRVERQLIKALRRIKTNATKVG